MITRSQTSKERKSKNSPSMKIDLKYKVRNKKNQQKPQKLLNFKIQRDKLENNVSPNINIHIHVSPVVNKFQTYDAHSNEPALHLNFDGLVNQTKISSKSRNSNNNYNEKKFPGLSPATISAENTVSVYFKDVELLTPNLKNECQRLVKIFLRKNDESDSEYKTDKEVQRSENISCKRKLCLDKIDYVSKYKLKKAMVVLEDICLKNSRKSSINSLSSRNSKDISNISSIDTNVGNLETNIESYITKESEGFIETKEKKDLPNKGMVLIDTSNKVNLNKQTMETIKPSEKSPEKETLELIKEGKKVICETNEEIIKSSKLKSTPQKFSKSSAMKNIVSHEKGNENQPCKFLSIPEENGVSNVKNQLPLSGLNGEVYSVVDSSDSEVTNNRKTSLTLIAENCNFSEIMKKIKNETVRNEILSYVKQKTSKTNTVENDSKKEKVEEIHDNLIDKQNQFVEEENQSTKEVNESVEKLENCIKEDVSVDHENLLQNILDVPEASIAPENKNVLMELEFSDTKFIDLDADKSIKNISEDISQNVNLDNTMKEIPITCNKNKTEELLNSNENPTTFKDLEMIQLECIKKEMVRRKIFSGKAKKRKHQEISKKDEPKPNSTQTVPLSPLKGRTIKKSKKPSKMKTSSKKTHTDGYIPLEVSGPTTFAVAPINKIDPYDKHDAKNFKNSVLYGNRIHRFGTSKELQVYRVKQQINREKHKFSWKN